VKSGGVQKLSSQEYHVPLTFRIRGAVPPVSLCNFMAWFLGIASTSSLAQRRAFTEMVQGLAMPVMRKSQHTENTENICRLFNSTTLYQRLELCDLE
jgi:hypothetical protein